MRASFVTVVPLVPSGADFDACLAFFVDHLGFDVLWRGGGLAGVARGGIALNLLHNASKEWAENASFSIGVSDLEALYEEYKDVPARVGPLKSKPWGRREFHVVIPSGVCLQFYNA